jgi:uncharacterized protein YkwD
MSKGSNFVYKNPTLGRVDDYLARGDKEVGQGDDLSRILSGPHVKHFINEAAMLKEEEVRVYSKIPQNVYLALGAVALVAIVANSGCIFPTEDCDYIEYPDNLPPHPSISEDAIAGYIYQYVNEERTSRGLDTLEWDNELTGIADGHSEDMAAKGFHCHTGSDGKNATERAIAKGYDVKKDIGGGWDSIGVAGNIGCMPTGNLKGGRVVEPKAEAVARAMVDSWMTSDGHRANILNPKYDQLGVGVGDDGKLFYFCTQDFI